MINDKSKQPRCQSCGRGINQPEKTGKLCHRCVKMNANKKIDGFNGFMKSIGIGRQ